MQTNSVADVLRALATGDKARSETARLRDVVDEVEAALAAGVSRAAILEALHGQGFTMTLKSFESALYRIRKQRGTAGQKTAQPPHPAPASMPSANTAPASAAAEVSAAPPAAPEAGEASPADDMAGLDKKQKREKLADRFLGDEAKPKNSLASRLIKQEKSK